MGLLNGHDELYFLWQDVSLLSENCLKTWAYSAYIRNRCYNKNTRKNPHESFTSSTPNLNKMHIFAPTCYFYVHIKRNWILVVKKASLSAMINKVQLN